MKTTKAHISTIQAGDTLLIDGEQVTIGKNDIQKCSFIGASIRGDSSVKMLTVVLFPKWFKGEITEYVRQV